jgi:hypothetical protein
MWIVAGFPDRRTSLPGGFEKNFLFFTLLQARIDPLLGRMQDRSTAPRSAHASHSQTLRPNLMVSCSWKPTGILWARAPPYREKEGNKKGRLTASTECDLELCGEGYFAGFDRN